MAHNNHPNICKHLGRRQRLVGRRQRQTGVVLIISLILLVVISLLAVTSMRNSATSEAVSGNVRTTELATQAAEIALRHCESAANKVVIALKVAAGLSTDTTSPEATYNAYGLVQNEMVWSTTPGQWTNTTSIWDSTSTLTYVLDSSLIGTTTYKRMPECMVESLTGVTPVSTNAAFVITARGFGPEVAAADASRTRPLGTEIWLQSTIEIP